MPKNTNHPARTTSAATTAIIPTLNQRPCDPSRQMSTTRLAKIHSAADHTATTNANTDQKSIVIPPLLSLEIGFRELFSRRDAAAQRRECCRCASAANSNVASFQLVCRLVRCSFCESGSLGVGELEIGFGNGNISTLATFSLRASASLRENLPSSLAPLHSAQASSAYS